MRINKFLAQNSGLSRRKADQAISDGRVSINGKIASLGDEALPDDQVRLDRQVLSQSKIQKTIILNKPVGYVCSRKGQGNKTIYDLLPKELNSLNPVGRLDKDSSGLLIMTNDGDLANQLTHPSYKKDKVYQVTLDKPLTKNHLGQITKTGIDIDDSRPSKFKLEPLDKSSCLWEATLQEGRNRQIRRTFEALDYRVTKLHRTHFGPYKIDNKVSKLGSFTKAQTR